MRISIFLVPALVLAMVFPVAADFHRVRSVPAGEGIYNLSGLDKSEFALFAVSNRGDCSSGCSVLYLLDPLYGRLLQSRIFIDNPPDCGEEISGLVSCAYAGNSFYWVGDACGDVIKIYWTADTLLVAESFLAPGPGGGANTPSQPTGLVCNAGLLHILDPGNAWIAVFDDYYDVVTGTLPLPQEIRDASSVTLHDGAYFVASAACDTIYQLGADGRLLGCHRLEGLGHLSPRGVTFIGDELFVASNSDSILVFEPSSINTEVPEGDSVAVPGVPGEVEVVFDSVSTAGWMIGDVAGSDSCRFPDGVTPLPDFYHLRTDAFFDYAAEVIISRTDPLPPGVDPARVRVFSRPSGACMEYRDITTAGTDSGRGLTALMRTKSEDDEFSVFVLGDDLRAPGQVVGLKFERLEGDFDAAQHLIPAEIRDLIRGLLSAARVDYYQGRSSLAASRADSIATIVRATPAIPHTFNPGVPGQNVAGRLISDAHTLAFSLRFSADRAMATDAVLVPNYIGLGHTGPVRAYLEVPPGLEAGGVETEHVYLEHVAQAFPESVSIGDYDLDGGLEIRAVFGSADVRGAIGTARQRTARLTCLLGGHEVFADARIQVQVATARMLDFAPLVSVGPNQTEPCVIVRHNPSASSFGFEMSRVANHDVDVRIYSVTGELVKSLFSGTSPAEILNVSWDGTDATGSRVAPGAYFVVVRAAGDTAARKVVLRR